MPNRHLTKAPDELIKAKLNTLLEGVKSAYNNGTFVTQGELVGFYNQAMSIFIKSLKGSIIGSSKKFIAGDPTDPSQYNEMVGALSKDIQALFLELGILDKFISSNFNSIIAEKNYVLSAAKRVANKIGDYLLYSDPKLGAGFFFSNNFSGLDKIELNSSLVELDECFVDQNEGVVFLPLDGSPFSPAIKEIIINEGSNGVFGNSLEDDVVGKDEIIAITDNNADTWIEYERVTAFESNTPLVLDLTIVLKDISIINNIQVNPMNFGTATPVHIRKIEVSKDGKNYFSIKDTIKIKDFETESIEDGFDLSSSASKSAGQGFYSFIPKKTKFIHIVFEQTSPYPIEDEQGTIRLRYAIGLRDINIFSRKFKSAGTLVSSSFSSEKEIKKLSIWADQDPIEKSILADTTHNISYDDGSSWYGIQPGKRSGTEDPEIINFNNSSVGSILTDLPVELLRHKISMERFSDGFNEEMIISQKRNNEVELLSFSGGGSPEVSLKFKPINGTVKAILPWYGSYSCPRTNTGSKVRGQSIIMDEMDTVEFSTDSSPINTLRYTLPFKNIKNLAEHIRVFINGEQIEYCPKITEGESHTSYGDMANVNSDSKVYFLNKEGKELQFGWESHPDDPEEERKGFIPTGGKIQVVLDGDNPYLSLTDSGYVLNLSSASDGIKENTHIVCLQSLSEEDSYEYQVTLPAGSRDTRIHEPIRDTMVNSQQTSRTLFYANEPLAGSAARRAETSNLIQRQNNAVRGAQLAAAGRARQANLSAQQARIYGNTLTKATDFGVEAEYDFFPPVYIPSTEAEPTTQLESWLKNNDGTIGARSNETWTLVNFIDGKSEFNNVGPGLGYSFDSYTGTAHLSKDTDKNLITTFKCKKIDTLGISPDMWDFYKDPITGKEDSKRINLSYHAAKTIEMNKEISEGSFSESLVDYSAKGHNWFKQKVVRGSVKPDLSIFQHGVIPVETRFINGNLEFRNTISVAKEPISLGIKDSANIYSFSLKEIDSARKLSGSLSFGAFRKSTNLSSPLCIFKDYKKGTLSSSDPEGTWTFDEDGIVKVKYAGVIAFDQFVSYSYSMEDTGVDFKGLYSIDYENGIIYFGNSTNNVGHIKLQVSLYSGFYNIANVLEDGDIEEIQEDQKIIKFSTALGMKLLKLNTIEKTRPAFVKISYEHYTVETESIKDLEPYFSPMCREIAFRSITSDLLEEL